MPENILENIILNASIEAQKNKLSEFKFDQIRRRGIKGTDRKDLPKNTELIPVYHKLLKSQKIKRSHLLEDLLRKKKMRTLSGVASITVITPDFGCPGKCIYCPTEKNMPKSYLSNEPAVMRAILNDFDPYRQIKTRLEALKIQGHETDKIELIIAGGTWSYIPEDYQIWFIANCYAAANSSKYIKKSKSKKRVLNSLEKTLLAEQKKNEKTKHRIVGLTLETRPDWINSEEIIKMRNYGCTRVELGVQSIYDNVLLKNGRGHTIKETIAATKLLKDNGFKINYHMMLGLPGSTPKKDGAMIEEIFKNPNFQPDMLKIYPCVVLKNSALYKLWKEKKYKPLSDKQIVKILKEAKTKIPEYCRIVRVIRDIPTPSIVAGGKISNLREVIHWEMKKEGKKCRCIRCREIKNEKFKAEDIKLKRVDYPASGGHEIFLSFEDIKNDKLVALLRLRINSGAPVGHTFEEHPQENLLGVLQYNYLTAKQIFRGRTSVAAGSEASVSEKVCPTGALTIFSTLKDSAIIREIHTYGQMEKINNKGETQHVGLGRKLIEEAEKIAKNEFNLKKIAVISGIGVRNYYRKSGYKLKDTYLVKNLSK